MHADGPSNLPADADSIDYIEMCRNINGVLNVDHVYFHVDCMQQKQTISLGLDPGRIVTCRGLLQNCY
jgi:hypothetical protein